MIDGAYSNKILLFTGAVSNPSVLTKYKNIEAAVQIEQPYLLNEARFLSAMVVHPLRGSQLGLFVSHSGFRDFAESSVSVLYARNLGKVFLGTEFIFLYSMASGFGTVANVNGGISCRLQLSQAFNAGFRIRNVAGLFFKNENNYAPILQAGAGFDFSEAVHLGCDWLQEPARSPIVTTGLLYRFHRLFIAIFGTMWSPCQPYGGFQLQQGNWKLLMKSSFHPVLGWSPSVGISFGKMDNDQE
jgi:hypothetical protein